MLDALQPAGFSQAQRIPGMTQAALAAILVYLKKKEMESTASAQAFVVEKVMRAT
jgi:tRNA U34 5-carboxymethylaminomethyl modifying enzyme MnmG/GidA